MLAGLAIIISFSPPRYRLGNLRMARADIAASSHEYDCRRDGRDVDALHNTHQKLSAKYAVAQKQHA
jgi:hypothetical protein